MALVSGFAGGWRRLALEVRHVCISKSMGRRCTKAVERLSQVGTTWRCSDRLAQDREREPVSANTAVADRFAVRVCAVGMLVRPLQSFQPKCLSSTTTYDHVCALCSNICSARKPHCSCGIHGHLMYCISNIWLFRTMDSVITSGCASRCECCSSFHRSYPQLVDKASHHDDVYTIQEHHHYAVQPAANSTYRDLVHASA